MAQKSVVPTLFRSRLDLTHFLCIPLATPSSRPRLLDARSRLMRDPVAANIPNQAFVWPDSQHIHIGSLSLPSPAKVEAARTLLESINLQEMLRRLRRNARLGDQYRVPDTTRNNTDADQPVEVSMTGLNVPGKYVHKVYKLRAPIADPEDILSNYVQEIKRIFTEAELLKLDPLQKRHGPVPLHASIVNCKSLGSTVKKDKLSVTKYWRKGSVPYKWLSLDVTELAELYAKYKDTVWASNIKLESLSIRQSRPLDFLRGQTLVGQGYHEIDSVPLPGTSHLGLDANTADLTYMPSRFQPGFDSNTTYDVTTR